MHQVCHWSHSSPCTSTNRRFISVHQARLGSFEDVSDGRNWCLAILMRDTRETGIGRTGRNVGMFRQRSCKGLLNRIYSTRLQSKLYTNYRIKLRVSLETSPSQVSVIGRPKQNLREPSLPWLRLWGIKAGWVSTNTHQFCQPWSRWIDFWLFGKHWRIRFAKVLVLIFHEVVQTWYLKNVYTTTYEASNNGWHTEVTLDFIESKARRRLHCCPWIGLSFGKNQLLIARATFHGTPPNLQVWPSIFKRRVDRSM